MKPSYAVLSWGFLPLAAAAGYLLGHQLHPMELPEQPGGPGTLPVPGDRRRTNAGMVATWTTRLQAAQVGDLPGLHEEILAMPELNERRSAQRLLCARWAEVDPAGGIAFYSKPPHRSIPSQTWILTEWALRDSPAAWEATVLLPEFEAAMAQEATALELIRENPEIFWQWFRKIHRPLPNTGGDHQPWEDVAAAHFEELAAITTDLLEKTEGGIRQMNNMEAARELGGILGQALAKQKGDQALEWAEAQPPAIRYAAVAGVLGILAKEAPEKIGTLLPKLKQDFGADPYLNLKLNQLVQTAAETLAARDPLASVRWLQTESGNLGNHSLNAYAVVGTALSKAMREGTITPQQAFAEVGVPGDSNRNVRVNVLHEMWKGLPPDKLAGAAAWLKTAAAGESRTLALAGLLKAWARQDRPASVEFAAKLHDPAIESMMFRDMASDAAFSASGNDVGDRLTTTLAGIPAPLRAEILGDYVKDFAFVSSIGNAASNQAPELAKALEGVPPGSSATRAVSKIASVWGSSDPEGALAWAFRQADAGLKETAIGSVVESWAKEDAWSTSQWINDLASGTERDICSHHLAVALCKEEPDSAWKWAGGIGEASTRLKARITVLKQWRGSAAEAADAAVRQISNDLPPGELEQLKNALSPPVKRK